MSKPTKPTKTPGAASRAEAETVTVRGREALRFPADVLDWRMCPRCWFRYSVRPGKEARCPMC